MFNQDEKSSLKKMIQGVFEEVDKTHSEKIVIDVRLCRGGNYNNAIPIIEEIKDRPVLKQTRQSLCRQRTAHLLGRFSDYRIGQGSDQCNCHWRSIARASQLG